MLSVVKNLKKSMLWRVGKFDEIDNFDEIHADYINEIINSGRMRRMITFKKDNKD